MKKSTLASKLEFRGYKALLYVLLVVLIAYPALQDYAYVALMIGIFLAAALMVAVRAVANLRKQFILSSILATVAIVGYFGALSGYGAAFEVMALLGFGLFFMAVGIIIMTNILLHIDRVTAEMIYGSINVYLLMGLSFAFLHALLEFIQPGSISGLASLSMGEKSTMPYVYYSFVTLTTLGYGDVSPMTGPAATIAYAEAIFGQFYIAILIARLMGLYVAQETTQDR